ncbi:hypothetical protein M433DRAFT_6141 [Acidomyces richmondensis BFW]|nr:MAG: hypothetical protein FE78DRAFT_543288 [Acidomyces sp. 'richmondensis']KYG43642.1 hypothetical protein M433DRAFT_6141 [Acidomyces richmondensis BFW]
MAYDYGSDESPPPRDRRARRPRRDPSRDYADYQRPPSRPRAPPPAYDEANRDETGRERDRRKPRRRTTYDASDEDDEYNGPRRSRGTGDVKRPGYRPSDDPPPIPRPPIGKDKDGPYDEKRGATDNASRERTRRMDDGYNRSIPIREKRRDPVDDSRRPRDNERDYGRDADYGRRDRGDPYSRRHRHDDPDDTDYARPRPRHEPERDRDRPRLHDRRRDYDRDDRDDRDDRGYRSDYSRRKDRDDYYDRGYRTDYGRDSRRDRDRDRRRREQESYDRGYDSRRDRPRPRERDRDRYDDYYRERGDHGRSSKDKKNKVDLSQMMEQGQKHWKTVEPIARPMLSALAKKYLAD